MIEVAMSQNDPVYILQRHELGNPLEGLRIVYSRSRIDKDGFLAAN